MVDVQRYMSDPLAYWLNHRHRYTNLFKRAKRVLCMPASTLPCRREYSPNVEKLWAKNKLVESQYCGKNNVPQKNFQSTVTQEYPSYGIFYQHFLLNKTKLMCAPPGQQWRLQPCGARLDVCHERALELQLQVNITSSNHYKWFWNSQKLNLPIITFCPHWNQTNLPIFIFFLLLLFHYLFSLSTLLLFPASFANFSAFHSSRSPCELGPKETQH